MLYDITSFNEKDKRAKRKQGVSKKLDSFHQNIVLSKIIPSIIKVLSDKRSKIINAQGIKATLIINKG